MDQKPSSFPFPANVDDGGVKYCCVMAMIYLVCWNTPGTVSRLQNFEFVFVHRPFRTLHTYSNTICLLGSVIDFHPGD